MHPNICVILKVKKLKCDHRKPQSSLVSRRMVGFDDATTASGDPVLILQSKTGGYLITNIFITYISVVRL